MIKTVLIAVLMLVGDWIFAGGMSEKQFIQDVDFAYAKYKEWSINLIEESLNKEEALFKMSIDNFVYHIAESNGLFSYMTNDIRELINTSNRYLRIYEKRRKGLGEDLRVTLSKYEQAIPAYNKRVEENEELLFDERARWSAIFSEMYAPTSYHFDIKDKEEYLRRLTGGRVIYRQELESMYNQIYFSYGQLMQEALNDKENKDKTRKVFDCFIAMEAIDELLYYNR
jgi:hypothetical protein